MGVWVADIGVGGLDEVASAVVPAGWSNGNHAFAISWSQTRSERRRNSQYLPMPLILPTPAASTKTFCRALPIARTGDKCLIRSLDHEQIVTAEQYLVVHLQLLPLLMVLKRTQWRCEVTSWHVLESDSHRLGLPHNLLYNRPVRVDVEHILVTAVPGVVVIPLTELCLIRANLVQDFQHRLAGQGSIVAQHCRLSTVCLSPHFADVGEYFLKAVYSPVNVLIDLFAVESPLHGHLDRLDSGAHLVAVSVKQTYKLSATDLPTIDFTSHGQEVAVEPCNVVCETTRAFDLRHGGIVVSVIIASEVASRKKISHPLHNLLLRPCRNYAFDESKNQIDLGDGTERRLVDPHIAYIEVQRATALHGLSDREFPRSHSYDILYICCGNDVASSVRQDDSNFAARYDIRVEIDGRDLVNGMGGPSVL